MLGHIETGPDGSYRLALTQCKICAKSHTTPIVLAEAKFIDDGDIYPYYTRCPVANRVIMLKSTNGSSIEIFVSEDLLKLALVRSDEPK